MGQTPTQASSHRFETVVNLLQRDLFFSENIARVVIDYWNVVYENCVDDLDPPPTDRKRVIENSLGDDVGEIETVYCARYQRTFVAVKWIHDLHAVEKIQNSCDIMLPLDHPSLCCLYGFNLERPFLLLELGARGRLSTILRNKVIYPELPWNARLSIILNVCHGLAYLHAVGIFHRDLKSEIIWLRKDWSAMIGDFQTAQWASTRMSPEEIAAEKSKDIYKLGLLLYEILTRKYPYEPFVVPSAGPSGYIDLINECCHQNLKKRPSAETVVKRIEALMVPSLWTRFAEFVFPRMHPERGVTDGHVRKLEQYKFEKLLGQGAQGMVYRVRDIATLTLYALKMIKRTQSNEVKRECNNLSKLKDCPYVCQMRECFSVECKMDLGLPFGIQRYWCVVLNYYAQGDLHQRIEAAKSSNSLTGRGEIEDELQILEWMLQLAEGVAVMHQLPVIHRDLKPQNIFLAQDQIRIGDFGVAIDNSQADSFVGTKGYYAPEVWEGGYGKAADMYSLGSVLLDLLTLSFAPDSHKKNLDRISLIPSHYSKRWPKIVESLLEKDSKKRCTARELGITVRKLRHWRQPRTRIHFGDHYDLTSAGPFLFLCHSKSLDIYDLQGEYLFPSTSNTWNPRAIEILNENGSSLCYILQEKSLVILNDYNLVAQWPLPDSSEPNIRGLCLKVDKDQIYFTLDFKHQVYNFTKFGIEIQRYGNELSDAEAEFDNPHGITVDEKFLYICDFGNDRVQKLEKKTGVFILEWGKYGSKNGEFDFPWCIRLADNFLYICDELRVQTFDKEGKFIRLIGSGELDCPRGLCVRKNEIYVMTSSRIHVFRNACFDIF